MVGYPVREEEPCAPENPGEWGGEYRGNIDKRSRRIAKTVDQKNVFTSKYSDYSNE